MQPQHIDIAAPRGGSILSSSNPVRSDLRPQKLLSLHSTAAGRVYAAYGGVYVTTALAWLWLIDGVRPTAWHVAGVAIAMGART